MPFRLERFSARPLYTRGDSHMASSSTASWEHWEPSWAHAAPAGWDDEADVEFDYNSVTKEQAGEEFVNFLVELKVKGSLSAKQACCLAWWAGKAGCHGEAINMGRRPDLQSGQYSRHFDKWAECSPRALNAYKVPLGRRVRHDATRVWQPLPMVPPHEALGEELSKSGEADAALRAAIRNGTLPNRYLSHPGVRDHLDPEAPKQDLVHPFCLYLDGVKYSRHDTVLGVVAYFLLTQQRHLIWCIRKSEVCNCGCRGTCSLRPMWEAIAWSCKAMLKGRHPTERHDRAPWGAEDASRAPVAGELLGFKAMCLFLKADWSEFVCSCGFPSWGHNMSPCPFCNATKEQLADVRGFSPLGMPHARKLHEHLARAALACEIIRVLNAEQIRKLRANMIFEKRAGQPRGRVLTRDLPELGFAKGDRLEGTTSYPDIHDLDPSQAPREVLMWRESEETFVKWRNPIFDDGTGVTLFAMVVDWLHCLSLGVFQYVLGNLWWELLKANAFNLAHTGATLHENGVAALKSRLWAWYKEETRQGRNHTRMEVLTLSMFGSSDAPQLHLHGAETNAALRFSCGALLPQVGKCLGGREAHYKVAIESCLAILELIRAHQQTMKPAIAQEFSEHVVAHLRSLKHLGISAKPKHHALMELATKIVDSGPPALSACWDDETANRILKCISGAAHALIFHERVLMNWRFLASGAAKRKR